MKSDLSIKGAKFDRTDDKLTEPAQHAAIASQQSSTSTSKPVDQKGRVEKYWKQPVASPGIDDIVVIHVCDENRQVSKDFCCKRGILIKHMKYFERFLAENENGYDDIDISVHCDVEIFEWLMSFIHEPDKPPVLEKSIVVSILISSEFLQMEPLVDLCLEHIAENLNDIIKLPIDLSCVSEKLINKLAMLTTPKILAQTRDRKDKILNKLYKRRVELDFSRKSGIKGGLRTIAASLTCCKCCGSVYLENCISFLACKHAPPVVDFRGRLARRHLAVPGWSLTAYLKSLHAGGMGWDAIYWHVWAACEVFMSQQTMVSALEVDRYSVESDGIILLNRLVKKPSLDEDGSKDAAAASCSFSLSTEEEGSTFSPVYKIVATPYSDDSLPPYITSTLNPNRPVEVLPLEVFELISSQMKYIANIQFKALVESTLKGMIVTSNSTEDVAPVDFLDILWGDFDNVIEFDNEEKRRGRSLSPAGRRGPPGKDLRKQAQSVGSKARLGDVIDSDSAGERRSRSSSVGSRARSTQASASSSSTVKPAASPLVAAKDKDRGKEGNSEGRRGKIAEDTDSVDSQDFNDPVSGQIIRSVPPDVTRAAFANKGNYRGIWLNQHPLQVQPLVVADTRVAIQESSLSDAKKFEWELDLMREFDEKRIDKIEIFLIGSRSQSAEVQLRSGSKPASKLVGNAIRKKVGVVSVDDGKTASVEYYKDRGRHPTKSGP